MAEDIGREGLGRPRGAQGRRRRRQRPARPPLHRPAPGPRGDQPAGLRGPAPGRPQAAPPGPHHRHRGPQHPHARHRQADRRPHQPHADRDAAQQLRRVRRPPALPGRQGAGHRARGRPAARPDPARHDRGLRRLAHLHPRRVRRDGVRHRHERGRARAGHPDAAAEAVQDHGHHRRGHAAARRHRQGHHPGGHRQDRHRRRPGLRPGVPRQRHPRAVHGGADDDLQHVDRGRRPRRHGRPGRDHLRLPEGPPARAGGRGLGRRRRLLAHPAHRRRRRLRRRGVPRRRHARAVRHLGHQPRPGRLAVRHGARPRRTSPTRTPGRRRARAAVHGPGGRHAA